MPRGVLHLVVSEHLLLFADTIWSYQSIALSMCFRSFETRVSLEYVLATAVVPILLYRFEKMSASRESFDAFEV